MRTIQAVAGLFAQDLSAFLASRVPNLCGGKVRASAMVGENGQDLFLTIGQRNFRSFLPTPIARFPKGLIDQDVVPIGARDDGHYWAYQGEGAISA